MRKFLTLKHWQLFGLLVGLPLTFQIITIVSTFSSNSPTTLFYFYPLMMISLIGIYFSWFYALGTNLHKKLPPTMTMNLTRFKIFLLFPVVYMLLLSVFMV